MTKRNLAISSQTPDRVDDPEYESEKTRYANPIPSRSYLLQLLQKQGRPLGFGRIAKLCKLSQPRELEALDRRLNAMVRDVQITRDRRQRYQAFEVSEVLTGSVIGHADGFGFFKSDEGGEDLFLDPRQMRQVMHGDRVEVQVIGVDHRGRKQARISKLLSERKTLVGMVEKTPEGLWLLPREKRNAHRIPLEDNELDLRTGDLVRADLTGGEQLQSRYAAVAVAVLGRAEDIGAQVEATLLANDIPQAFSETCQRAADQLGSEVRAEDKYGREDLRDFPFVTIDGEDARDFDDAVFCRPTPSGWRLLVAIADVAHYVPRHGDIDSDAWARGTSVYLPDRVIPMLPEALSNGLCSLRPEVDRLALVCDMVIRADGSLHRTRFRNAVIHSHARLTYTQVAAAVFEEDRQVQQELEHVMPALRDLQGLFYALLSAREARGAMDFDFPEPVIEVDEQGQIAHVSLRQRNDAHRLIEECMVMANVAAARTLLRHRYPALLRVHEGINPQRLADLQDFLKLRGLTLGAADEPPDNLEVAGLLAKVAERDDAEVIQTEVLRSLNQAIYARSDKGHFGLALEHYAHFTSPIRRYPDLVVHRMLKQIIAGVRKSEADYSDNDVAQIGIHCSMTERRAETAVRDIQDLLKCLYMQKRVGETFAGTITTATAFGIFVRLDDFLIDGLVHISALPSDYYVHDARNGALVGRDSGRRFGAGDRVQARVVAARPEERRIDLLLEQDEAEATSGKKARKAKSDKSDKSEKSGKKRKSAKAKTEVPAKTDEKSSGKKKRRRK